MATISFSIGKTSQNWKNLKEVDEVWKFPNKYEHLFQAFCKYVADEDKKLAPEVFFKRCLYPMED